MAVRRKQQEDTTLEQIYSSPTFLETSIGSLEVQEYRLRELAKVAPIISRLFYGINIEQLDKGAAPLEAINLPYMLDTLADGDSSALLTLISCAVRKSPDELENLTVTETGKLINLVFQIAIKPMLTDLGNELKPLFRRAK